MKPKEPELKSEAEGTLTLRTTFKNSDVARVFPGIVKILNIWKCTDNDKSMILGLESEEAFLTMHSDPERHTFSDDQILRMSYILNIYRTLHNFFSNPESQNNWVNKPNKAAIFKGKPAIELMKSGGLSGLAAVAHYLHSFP